MISDVFLGSEKKVWPLSFRPSWYQSCFLLWWVSRHQTFKQPQHYFTHPFINCLCCRNLIIQISWTSNSESNLPAVCKYNTITYRSSMEINSFSVFVLLVLVCGIQTDVLHRPSWFLIMKIFLQSEVCYRRMANCSCRPCWRSDVSTCLLCPSAIQLQTEISVFR